MNVERRVFDYKTRLEQRREYEVSDAAMSGDAAGRIKAR
jgi:hypothetical protein